MKTEFKSGQTITTKVGAIFPGEKSEGTVIGWAGYSKDMCVRVEWRNGDIKDYRPERLEEMIESIN